MMRLITSVVVILFYSGVIFAAPEPTVQQQLETDAPQATDFSLTGRYEGSYILSQTIKAFDELTLPAGPAVGESWDANKKFSSIITPQGKITRLIYIAPAGRSSLEVFNNYKDALISKGFAPVFECANAACGPSFMVLKYRWDNKSSLVQGAGYADIRNHLIQAAFDNVKDLHYLLLKKADTYVAIYAGVHTNGSFGDYSHALDDRAGVLLEIAEPKPMETRMVILNAAEINKDVMNNGRAVFYGILFDFDKADIKPESEPQLAEMARALQDSPKLTIYIVGHTDNAGQLDYNTHLSERRAAAVVKALTIQYGIDAQRLIAKGVGQLAPVASNQTDEGRAKNRRVEMVAK